MLREAPLYIDGQAAVVGGAVGVVGDQVAERNRLTAEAEAVVRHDFLREPIELRRQRSNCRRGVEAALAEEAHQRRRNVGSACRIAAFGRDSAD